MGHLGSNYEVSLLTKGFPPLQGWPHDPAAYDFQGNVADILTVLDTLHIPDLCR
jgi:hypothetical protein